MLKNIKRVRIYKIVRSVNKAINYMKIIIKK